MKTLFENIVNENINKNLQHMERREGERDILIGCIASVFNYD